jgi:hypothetical protein
MQNVCSFAARSVRADHLHSGVVMTWQAGRVQGGESATSHARRRPRLAAAARRSARSRSSAPSPRRAVPPRRLGARFPAAAAVVANANAAAAQRRL